MSERNVTPLRFPGRMSPQLVTIVVAVLAVVILFSTSFYVVDQREEAVLLRFGKVKGINGPGLHFKLPFGIDKNHNVATQLVFKREFGFRSVNPGVNTQFSNEDFSAESVMLTGDKNIVDVEWIIQYRITDPVAWLFHVDNQERTISDISRSVMNLLVGDRTILGVMGTDRPAIQVKAQERMNQRFKEFGLGINVTTVAMQDILPPQGAVRNAFEDVNKAEQDRERFINEGNAARNQAVPEAEGKAKRIVQEAEGYRAARVNKANGDVARFRSVLAEYRLSRDVTRTRLYIEMYEEVFGGKDSGSTDLIDRNLQNFIPLKQLTEQAVQPPKAPAPAAGGTR
jgi:modulator of FtsH protease HflK